MLMQDSLGKRPSEIIFEMAGFLSRRKLLLKDRPSSQLVTRPQPNERHNLDNINRCTKFEASFVRLRDYRRSRKLALDVKP